MECSSVECVRMRALPSYLYKLLGRLVAGEDQRLINSLLSPADECTDQKSMALVARSVRPTPGCGRTLGVASPDRLRVVGSPLGLGFESFGPWSI